jgi:AbiV family abortive infection protein
MASIDESVLRRTAIASLDNARNLYKDSNELAKVHRYGTAASLAIVGIEEVGKCLLFTLAALGVVPELETHIAKALKEHELKQLLCEYSDISAWLVDEYRSIISQAAGFPYTSDAAWIEEFLVTLLQDPSTDCLLRKARERLKQRSDFLKNDFDSYENKQMLKHRGLYVDLRDNGDVTTPESVTDTEMQCELGELKSSLDTFQRLYNVLKSDADWEIVKKNVKARLTSSI